MSSSVRDASLTTHLRKIRALAAYRTNTNFPVNNTVRPEQPNTQTGDVPTNAKLGACVDPLSTANFTAGYSFYYGRQSEGASNSNF